MPTFPANIYPEYDGNATSVTPRILETKLGDGYTQRCADGLNTLDEEDSWVFRLTDTDADTVEAFLVARGGWEAFDWQPPRQLASKKWVCMQWKRTYEAGARSTITCTFKRVWDL